MKITAYIFLYCALCLSYVTSQAQIRIVPRERLEAVDSPRLSSDSSSLGFDTRHIVAEPMKEDDAPAVFRFEMTNTGERPISVLKLQTTCSCVSASVGQRALKPGDKTTLTVRYDPEGHLGHFEHKVFVYTGPGNEPSAALRLTVEVQSPSDISGLYRVGMGKIALRSRNIAFKRDVKSVEVLKFINLSDNDLKLECEEMFLPECISLETRPVVTGSGKEGEIIVSYDPSMGTADDSFPIILKNLGVSPSSSTIYITIE